MSSHAIADAEVTERSLCDGLHGKYSFPLHIFAIFVVLFASIIGTILPMITKCIPVLRNNPFIFVIAKTAATGVLLSVSAIHLTGDAAEALEEECVPEAFRDFYGAPALFFMSLSALAMHAVDFRLGEIAERWVKRKEATEAPKDGADDFSTANPIDKPRAGQDSIKESDDHGQSSAVMLPGSGHTHSVALPDKMASLRRIIAAVSMEFGVTLHSVFVGLDMGLTTDDSLKPLLVALVFHQLFEGMALGSRLVDARFSIALDLVLALVFSVSAPFGMTISTIAVSIRNDAMSGGAFVMTLGILSSCCGGILLYLAFSLLFSDFSMEMQIHCGDGVPHRVSKKVAMFTALWTGMLTMAVVGKWL